jgi:hypothetical protein
MACAWRVSRTRPAGRRSAEGSIQTSSRARRLRVCGGPRIAILTRAVLGSQFAHVGDAHCRGVSGPAAGNTVSDRPVRPDRLTLCLLGGHTASPVRAKRTLPWANLTVISSGRCHRLVFQGFAGRRHVAALTAAGGCAVGAVPSSGFVSSATRSGLDDRWHRIAHAPSTSSDRPILGIANVAANTCPTPRRAKCVRVRSRVRVGLCRSTAAFRVRRLAVCGARRGTLRRVGPCLDVTSRCRRSR